MFLLAFTIAAAYRGGGVSNRCQDVLGLRNEKKPLAEPGTGNIPSVPLSLEDGMNTNWYKTLTWMMWLILATAALNYWRVWNRLPASMAVHFDANWHPNGYASREGALMLGLGIMALLVVVFTIGALIARAFKPVASWPLLLVAYVVLGFAWFGNYYIIQFNLSTPPAIFRTIP